MVQTKVLNWIKNNQREFFLLCLLLLFSAFLRFYRLPEYMTFLGDEGRDALVIKELLVNHHYPFIGPPTSIGNIYLGPLYYYMMALPMTIFWLNPAAAAYQVAVIGVLTIALIYYLSRVWFGTLAAFLAAFLYAISPVTIVYSRSSWNPNPAPFFALLSVFGLFKSHRSGNFLWFILSGAALAFAVQMHYLALILLPVFAALWLYEFSLWYRGKLERKHFYTGTIGAILAFLALMSPLAIFDIRHNFMNYRAMLEFFTNRQTTVNINPFNTVERVYPIYNHDLISRYFSIENPYFNIIISVAVLLPLIFGLYLKFKKHQLMKWSYLMLGIWLFGAVAGLALYKQNIYDHYLGFVNPVPFILLGALTSLSLLIKQLETRRMVFVVLFFLFTGLIVSSLSKNPLLTPPNSQLKKTQDISRFVISKTANKPFNFALLSKNNYDSAYQFYLDFYGYKPMQVPFNITEQLFVVCEDAVCEPLNNPKYEIAGFGWAKIDWQEDVNGVKVFKLSHNPEEQKQKLSY